MIDPSAPMSDEVRARRMKKIFKESQRIAALLKAKGVMIIAFYEKPVPGTDGASYIHTLDGGESPWDRVTLYSHMARMYQTMRITGQTVITDVPPESVN